MIELYDAFAFGVVAGARSMLAPALAARALAAQAFAVPSARRTADGAAAWFLSSPRVVQLLPLAAAAELIADKLPWTPARTDPGPLLGRLGSGALVGAAMASREHRTAAAFAGAAGALAGTFAWYHARRLATDRGLPGWLAAVTEDALALGLGIMLLRRGSRIERSPDV